MKNSIKNLIILSLFIASCGDKKKDEEQKILEAKNNVITEVVGVGRIEPESEIIQLSTENSGVIAKIFKQENDSVKAGETIAILDNDIENAELNQAKSKVQTFTRQLNIDQASIKEAKSKLNNAQTNANRLRSLFNQGAETKQVLDNAETETRNLAANLEKQQSQLQYSKSQISEQSAAIQLANAKINQKKIKSPVNGTILEWKKNIGEGVANQEIVAQISPRGRIIVVSEIDELFADKIQINQKVIIRKYGDSIPIAKGKIFFASDFLKKKSLFTEQSGEAEDRRVRLIKIELENPKNLLLNSRVETVINLKK
jgi:multidrug efflux pump subunit AcrA (membrane-fusion protein)